MSLTFLGFPQSLRIFHSVNIKGKLLSHFSNRNFVKATTKEVTEQLISRIIFRWERIFYDLWIFFNYTKNSWKRTVCMRKVDLKISSKIGRTRCQTLWKSWNFTLARKNRENNVCKWCVDFTKFLRKNRKKKLSILWNLRPTHLVLNQIVSCFHEILFKHPSFHVFLNCEYILVPILPDMNSYINNFFPLLGFLFLIKFFCHSMQSSVCTNYKLVSECKNSPNFILIGIH